MKIEVRRGGVGAFVVEVTRPNGQGARASNSVRLSCCPLRSPVSQSISRWEIHIRVQTTAHHGGPNLWLLP